MIPRCPESTLFAMQSLNRCKNPLGNALFHFFSSYLNIPPKQLTFCLSSLHFNFTVFAFNQFLFPFVFSYTAIALEHFCLLFVPMFGNQKNSKQHLQWISFSGFHWIRRMKLKQNYYPLFNRYVFTAMRRLWLSARILWIFIQNLRRHGIHNNSHARILNGAAAAAAAAPRHFSVCTVQTHTWWQRD